MKDWDYSSPWWYFVTININTGSFGLLKDGIVEYNRLGEKVDKEWSDIPLYYSETELDDYIIMPDHIHGIVIIEAENKQKPHTLGNILGSFKSSITKWAHENDYKKFKWQKRFFDRIIRNEQELYKIRRYIELNPLKKEIELDF